MTMVQARPARGELIARGNTSNVWRWSGTTVVKVLRPEIPPHWAWLEYEITRRVREAGLPVPASDGVIEVDGRPGIMLEYVAGPSMWTRMKAHPHEVPRLVDELVDLQEQVLAAGPVEGLPDIGLRLHRKIDEALQLQEGDRAAAHRLLAGLPTGTALCHGDMHPANVLGSPGGWVIVDWFDAAIGYPVADYARSSLLMPPASAVESANRHLDGVTAYLLGRLHDSYLASLARRGHIDRGPFEAWEAVLAVARMSEPVQTSDLHQVWRRWRDDHPGPEG
jgi:aminoglycoside phosphotransferase (APT) family kinase protein